MVRKVNITNGMQTGRTEEDRQDEADEAVGRN